MKSAIRPDGAKSTTDLQTNLSSKISFYLTKRTYFSTMTLLTAGSEIVAVSRLARVIVLIEVFIFVIVISMIIFGIFSSNTETGYDNNDSISKKEDTVLLDNEGRDAFLQYCDEHEISGHMPRVQKLKDFLNSAADKFEPVDHVNHMNLLYINWSYSEFEEEGYQEAFSLLANNSNGILTHKNIGLNLGLKEEVYDKITAIVVYTESLHGLMFGEFRFVWMRDYMGQPHFGIIPLHDEGDIFKVTGINPYSEQLTPIFTGFLREPKHSEALIQIIGEHMLKL